MAGVPLNAARRGARTLRAVVRAGLLGRGGDELLADLDELCRFVEEGGMTESERIALLTAERDRLAADLARERAAAAEYRARVEREVRLGAERVRQLEAEADRLRKAAFTRREAA